MSFDFSYFLIARIVNSFVKLLTSLRYQLRNHKHLWDVAESKAKHTAKPSEDFAQRTEKGIAYRNAEVADDQFVEFLFASTPVSKAI